MLRSRRAAAPSCAVSVILMAIPVVPANVKSTAFPDVKLVAVNASPFPVVNELNVMSTGLFDVSVETKLN